MSRDAFLSEALYEADKVLEKFAAVPRECAYLQDGGQSRRQFANSHIKRRHSVLTTESVLGRLRDYWQTGPQPDGRQPKVFCTDTVKDYVNLIFHRLMTCSYNPICSLVACGVERYARDVNTCFPSEVPTTEYRVPNTEIP